MGGRARKHVYRPKGQAGLRKKGSNAGGGWKNASTSAKDPKRVHNNVNKRNRKEVT